ncbi:MAG TPA: hypothetical protein VLL05_01295 [Terriglobales bacterium]|nr:hypothetical protein [Terriglobales bacterium]
MTRLREREYAAVVIDQFVIDAEPDEGKQMLHIWGPLSRFT